MSEVRPPEAVDGIDRQLLVERYGVPHDLAKGTKGAYLSAWARAHKEDRELLVKDAAFLAGVKPALVRRWRADHPEFKAAEAALRANEPFEAPVLPEPHRKIEKYVAEAVAPPPPPLRAPTAEECDHALSRCCEHRGSKWRREQRPPFNQAAAYAGPASWS